MAKYDAQLDIGVNPIVNIKKWEKDVAQLRKILKSGTEKEAVDLISGMIRTLRKHNLAASPTQGRMEIESITGKMSAKDKATFRMAQNRVQLEESSAKQQLREEERIAASIERKKLSQQRSKERVQSQYQSLVERATYLKEDFQEYKENPTRHGGGVLTGKATSLLRDIQKFLDKSTRVNKKEEEYLRVIALNTSAMKKDVQDTEKKEERKTSLIAGAKKASAALFGISSFIGLLKRGYKGVQGAFERGMQALQMEAAYGKTVDWRDVTTRSALFKMSKETAAEPSKYAGDFRQRLLWGEVGEREIIGLSRAGEWGKMVMSGEAARNPKKAAQAFEDLVASTDKAEMRSILGQIGLSQENMNYNMQAYDAKTRGEYSERFSELVDAEKFIAVSFFDVANQADLLAKEISKVVGEMAGEAINYASPQSRAAAENLKARFGIEGHKISVEKIKKDATKDIGLIAPAKAFSEGQNSPQITLNVTNNNTINGTGGESAEDYGKRLGGATAGAIYTDLAKIMGGRTGF